MNGLAWNYIEPTPIGNEGLVASNIQNAQQGSNTALTGLAQYLQATGNQNVQQDVPLTGLDQYLQTLSSQQDTSDYDVQTNPNIDVNNPSSMGMINTYDLLSSESIAVEDNRGLANPNIQRGSSSTIKGDFASPVDSNLITSSFGKRNIDYGSKNHKGLDLRARMGDSIYAMSDGVVKSAGGQYGTIVIDHGNGLTTKYMHMNDLKVKPGDTIKKGQFIGSAGGKGPKGLTQYTPHLHLEVLRDGKHIDPEQIFKGANIQLARK